MRNKRNWTGLACFLLAVGCSGAVVYAQPSSAQTPSDSTGTQAEFDPGLAVGTVAPAFVLRNQANEEVSLAQLVSNSTVALVFFRSAEW